MKLFVESWESVLYHSDGSSSNGYKAVYSNHGNIEPYTSRGRNLYIHYLEVGLVREENLSSHFDNIAQRTITGRRASSSGNWWLCKTPSAYANVDLGSGAEKVRARLSQLKA